MQNKEKLKGVYTQNGKIAFGNLKEGIELSMDIARRDYSSQKAAQLGQPGIDKDASVLAAEKVRERTVITQLGRQQTDKAE